MSDQSADKPATPDPAQENKLAAEPSPGDATADEEVTDELLKEMTQNGEILITDEVASDAPEKTEENSHAEEDAIRSELGIGRTNAAIDRGEIDDLLEGANVGYEEIFSEVEGEAVPRGESEGGSPLDANLRLLRDVHMKVKVELGRGQMYLKDILRLGQGSVVELERLAGDPLDIYVNDKLVARGEVLVLNENFCIRITEIFNPAQALMG